MKTSTSTSKKIVWTILVIALAVMAIAFYEIFKFKPQPPVTDESGRIISTSENGFRHFKTPPEVY